VNLIILYESLRKNLLPYQSKNGAKAAQGDGIFRQVRVALLQRIVNSGLSAAMKTEMTTEMKTG
jgi:hypothetical protein